MLILSFIRNNQTNNPSQKKQINLKDKLEQQRSQEKKRNLDDFTQARGNQLLGKRKKKLMDGFLPASFR